MLYKHGLDKGLLQVNNCSDYYNLTEQLCVLSHGRNNITCQQSLLLMKREEKEKSRNEEFYLQKHNAM
jgi:hypothetical protein